MHKLPVLVVLLLASACTRTVMLPMNPTYAEALHEPQGLASVKPPVSIRLGEFSDMRPDTSKVTVFKQGVYTFNVYGKRPIAEVLTDGLRVLFTKAGHAWGESQDARVRLDLQLLNTSTDRNAGFVKVGARSAVQIKLDVVDTISERLIYSQVYNGTDTRDRALVGTMGMVRASFDQALVNCIENVGADAKLAAALRQIAEH